MNPTIRSGRYSVGWVLTLIAYLNWPIQGEIEQKK